MRWRMEGDRRNGKERKGEEEAPRKQEVTRTEDRTAGTFDAGTLSGAAENSLGTG